MLGAKSALRILRDRERRVDTPSERDYKRVVGGLLVQERDSAVENREGMNVVCGSVEEPRWDEIVFAWSVCKHVSSNAIVLAREGADAGLLARPDDIAMARWSAVRAIIVLALLFVMIFKPGA